MVKLKLQFPVFIEDSPSFLIKTNKQVYYLWQSLTTVNSHVWVILGSYCVRNTEFYSCWVTRGWFKLGREHLI